MPRNSRPNRWGEEEIGGFADDQRLLCLGLALWSGRDPILKEPGQFATPFKREF